MTETPSNAPIMHVGRDFTSYFETLKRYHDFKPSICIDVGAAYGTQPIYEAFPEALHVAIEPLESMIAPLKATLAPYRHAVVQAALAETPGSRQMIRLADAATSSLMHNAQPDDDRLVDVPCYTLDAIVDSIEEQGPILLKTDCQGGDLDVLKGGLRALQRCEVVVTEVSFFPFWGPQHPDFFTVVQFMKDQGFVVHDLMDGLCRPLDHALGQIDVAFVKETGRFRQKLYW